ncbi:helix-turn-helix domain-containing protein [Acetobacter estunensis]|nr:helix-turn-helix domain-containing protein [Acetobacter estunensis]MBV1836110.1 helix-turn-helix domain-containing protein [Acetobacter estunensis]
MNAINRRISQGSVVPQDAARRLNVSLETVRLWRCGKRKVSVGRVADVCAIFGITPEDVRPDIFGPSPSAEPPAITPGQPEGAAA